MATADSGCRDPPIAPKGLSPSAPAPWNSSLLASLGLGELDQVPTRLYLLESAQYLAQQLTDSKASVNVCWESGKRKMEEEERIGQGALNCHCCCCLIAKLYLTLCHPMNCSTPGLAEDLPPWAKSLGLMDPLLLLLIFFSFSAMPCGLQYFINSSPTQD